ncbi:MAG: phospholipid carrier-dependent glycosyltransferase [Gammaproteobacteria bacterium]|nr:phospholipid carrier-dependent glycosyltransferase [Gammaproteobacteria bacterium]
MRDFLRRPVALYGVASFFSIVLTLIAVQRTWVINPDGMCYLQMAEAIYHGLDISKFGCAEAGPFFSMVMAKIAQFTGAPFLVIGNTLDGFFSLLSVLFFIGIVRQLTSDHRIQWLAVLVILISHEFNAIRSDIIRDHGFWAFYLISMYLFLRYISLEQNRKRIFTALSLGASLIIAGLFRVEGFVFLMLVPFTVLVLPESFFQRITRFIEINLLSIIAGISLFIWLLMHPHHHAIARLQQLHDHLIYGFPIFIDAFQSTADRLALQVLSVYSARDAQLILFLMLVSWYVVSVIVNLTLVFSALVMYAWVKKLAQWKKSQHIVIWAYVLINVLITFVVLAENLFLAKRYLLALSLTLTIWVPFALNDVLIRWKNRRGLLFLLALLLIYTAMGGICQFGANKKYVRLAGDWAAQHVPNHVKIFSNDYQLMYYSHHTDYDLKSGLEFIQDGKWRNYDWLMLHVNHDAADAAIVTQITESPVKTFHNHRNDQILIYHIHHTTN